MKEFIEMAPSPKRVYNEPSDDSSENEEFNSLAVKVDDYFLNRVISKEIVSNPENNGYYSEAFQLFFQLPNGNEPIV